MHSRPRIARRRLAGLAAFSALLAGVMAPAPAAHATPPAFHMLDNGRLRFGGNNNNSCRSGCATIATPEDSVSSIGLLKQPFYFSTVDSMWHKLTYSTYPLNLAIGTGTAGTNWSGSTVFEFNPSANPANLSGLTVDTTGYTALGSLGSGDNGYGTVISNGTATINGQTFAVTEKFELGATASFVKITTTLQNTSGTDATNVNMWVGTQDDYVGSNDSPTKTKGNLVNGAFAATTNATDPASALLIESGPEGVLFYSTTPATNVSINTCCRFRNAYNVNPTSSPLNQTNDGSYAMNLPVGNLANGASAQIVWFYGAGATADLGAIAAAVAAAGSPTPPSSIVGDHQATISWVAPSSQSPITDYSIRYRVNGSSGAWVEVRKGDATAPLSRTITGLTDGVDYEFQVAAVTGTAPNEVIGAYSTSTTAQPGTPLNNVPPTIAGTPITGSTLSAVDPDANWSSTDGSPMTAGYQWQSDGVDIPGATSMTFVVPRALVGTALRVVASRTNASGTASVASATVAVVASSPTAVSLSMGSSTVGAAVSTTVSADGGPAPTFAVTAGSLPAGLSLDSVTGVISGTPTTAGAYSFEITATNSAGSAAATFTGTVAGPVPASLSLTLGSLTTGTAVSATVTATGYPAPTFTVTAGALPAGLSLDLVTGVVSGTPTTPGSYSFEVTASNSAGSASATFTGTVAPAPNPSLGSFAPLPSSRVLDSRSTGAPIPAGSVQVVHVAGVAGVPNDASAAVLNITVDGGGEAGFVTTFPCGTPLPDTSNLNIAAGQTVANAVTVAMGTDGDVCVYSSVAVNLIVDISGVYSHNAGSALLTPLSPLRLLDTRLAGGNVAAGTVRELQVAGVAGVPVDAMAVVLNVTATRTLGDGFVTAFACGSAVPATSNVNFVAGATAANAVTTAIDSAGKVCFYSSAAIDLVVDVSDAFSPTGTAWLVPLAPVRLLDTRSSANPVAAGSVQEVQVAGLGGVPVGSVAAVLNVTATGTAGVGYLTIFPCGSARPEASNLNFVIGQTVANAVTATLGTDGKVCIYNSADTHLVVDLNGAYGQPV